MPAVLLRPEGPRPGQLLPGPPPLGPWAVGPMVSNQWGVAPVRLHLWVAGPAVPVQPASPPGAASQRATTSLRAWLVRVSV